MSQYEELDALYASLPKVECKRLCQQYCGPILIPKIEAARLEEKRGWLDITTDFIPEQRPHIPASEIIQREYVGLKPPLAPHDLSCVFLIGNKCICYSIRPLVCRAWGCVDNEWLRCPFGCIPTPRWITEQEFKELNIKVVEIQNKKGESNDRSAKY